MLGQGVKILQVRYVCVVRAPWAPPPTLLVVWVVPLFPASRFTLPAAPHPRTSLAWLFLVTEKVCAEPIFIEVSVWQKANVFETTAAIKV